MIIPLTSDIKDIYSNVDSTALVAVLARTTLCKIYYQPIPNLKNDIIAAAKRIYLTAKSINGVRF